MKVVTFLLPFLLIGCASGYVVPEVKHTLGRIQKAVKNKIPGGINKVSQNRREIFSGIIDPSVMSKTYRGGRDVYRASVHVLILGDRRPYDLKIHVYIEKRVSGGKPKRKIFGPGDLKPGVWEDFGEDIELAKRIGDSIYEYLLKTSRNRNLIDDFRPF